MNNILISILRFAVIVGVLLFAFTGEVFAAPVLTPVSAKVFSATSITLRAEVSNPVWENTSVWFEWGETSLPTAAVGVTSVYNQGPFEVRLSDLKPGVTYYFRAVASEGGVTVYSPNVASLTLSDGTQTTIINTTNTVNNNIVTNKTSTTNEVGGTAKPPQTKSAISNSSTKKVVVASVVNKNCDDAKTTTGGTLGTQTNTNLGASVIASGAVMPSTLIGWVALMVALLFVVLVVHMIFDSNQKRKKMREEKEALRWAKEMEDETKI